MQLVINSVSLRRYRRRALRTQPKEYLELLIGIKIDKTLYIQDFVAVKQIATNKSVSIDLDDSDRIESETKASGRIILGNIHSHPHWSSAYPSECDNDLSRDCKEYVFGIFHIGSKSLRTKTTTKWWPTQNPVSLVSYS